MPHRSLELFHHFAHYRIFTRTAVRKNPNSQCVGIAFSNPGTFRACLIMSALHFSWLSGGPQALQQGSEMEETYLLHKLEAMRLVKKQLADPERCTSDSCLSLIAALALAESGMGDPQAAQAHINGLFTLIDMRKPEEWQHRFYGMLQRVILMAGSFISSSCDASQATSLATRLSPFYLTTTPGMEVCKADVEAEVLINALSRLTTICYPSNNTNEIHAPHTESTATLLKDTEAYIFSLLFKPHSPIEGIEPTFPSKTFEPYSTAYPSATRASATAAWFYLYFVLRPLRPVEEETDPHLLRLLMDTLKLDIQATEPTTRNKSSTELWGWKVMVGLYTLIIIETTNEEVYDTEEGEGEYIDSLKTWFSNKLGVWGYTAKIEEWQVAKQVLRRIVWPEEEATNFDGDRVIEGIWSDMTRSSESEGASPSSILIDPLLWEAI
ncbi:hypothetical protein QBC38DRAFT_120357 [Podospora fimiseda]|uniref:Uncharacterized protein n=1 Tax=Podospora fimiseda TaxID=252190 RepID=A0AAN7BUL4_9PEZI|nr:hypothetical protein QBC38DRAFT_120357 [Podospora fimiseda]